MRKVDLGPDETGPKWPSMSGDARVAVPGMVWVVGKQNSLEHPCEHCGSTTTCDCPVDIDSLEYGMETQYITSRERVCVVCGNRYYGGHVFTCSEACHERFVAMLVEEFGEHKRVVDAETGKAYRVPTRDIIEKGLRHADLVKYPEWKP
jgi:hypothetical protein